MPRERSNVPAVQDQSGNTLPDLPQDVLADLLAAQAGELGSNIELPKIKVMPAGVGMFEFDDNNQRAETFRGIILGSHAKNVLWDKQFGQQSANPEENLPACSATDGRFGTPREGFHHLSLPGNRRFMQDGRNVQEAQALANDEGEAAVGVEVIECRSCIYNQWGTGKTFRPNANEKGKANTNQRVIYVLTEDRVLPSALVIPPTSLSDYDKYVSGLTNRSIPVQAVITTFSQVVLGSGGVRYGTVKFDMAERLDPQVLMTVLQKRKQYESYINPALRGQMPVETQIAAPAAEPQAEPRQSLDDIPF
jgi:hypothetical protein